MATYLPMLPIRNSSRLIGPADRPQSLIQRRFGHQAALIAGIERSRADAVIMLDSDLQHPLELITRLVACWEEGADLFALRSRPVNFIVWCRRARNCRKLPLPQPTSIKDLGSGSRSISFAICSNMQVRMGKPISVRFF